MLAIDASCWLVHGLALSTGMLICGFPMEPGLPHSLVHSTRTSQKVAGAPEASAPPGKAAVCPLSCVALYDSPLEAMQHHFQPVIFIFYCKQAIGPPRLKGGAWIAQSMAWVPRSRCREACRRGGLAVVISEKYSLPQRGRAASYSVVLKMKRWGPRKGIHPGCFGRPFLGKQCNHQDLPRTGQLNRTRSFACNLVNKLLCNIWVEHFPSKCLLLDLRTLLIDCLRNRKMKNFAVS